MVTRQISLCSYDDDPKGYSRLRTQLVRYIRYGHSISLLRQQFERNTAHSWSSISCTVQHRCLTSNRACAWLRRLACLPGFSVIPAATAFRYAAAAPVLRYKRKGRSTRSGRLALWSLLFSFGYIGFLFGPGNGFPNATNVVIVGAGVLVIRFAIC